MKTNPYFRLITIIAFILIIGTFFLFFNDKYNLLDTTKNNTITEANKSGLKSHLNAESDTVITLNNIELVTYNNEKIHLGSIIKNKTLIFCYTENCCPPCINDYFDILNQLSDSINSNQIIILSRYDNIRKMKIKKIEKQVKVLFFNSLEKFNLSFDKIDMERPYFLTIDNKLNSSFRRFGTPEDSISNPYFRRIIQYLKSEG